MLVSHKEIIYWTRVCKLWSEIWFSGSLDNYITKGTLTLLFNNSCEKGNIKRVKKYVDRIEPDMIHIYIYKTCLHGLSDILDILFCSSRNRHLISMNECISNSLSSKQDITEKLRLIIMYLPYDKRIFSYQIRQMIKSGYKAGVLELMKYVGFDNTLYTGMNRYGMEDVAVRYIFLYLDEANRWSRKETEKSNITDKQRKRKTFN